MIQTGGNNNNTYSVYRIMTQLTEKISKRLTKRKQQNRFEIRADMRKHRVIHTMKITEYAKRDG